MAMMTARVGSTRSARVPRTEAGRRGRGCSGGADTNWKRSFIGPSSTLPRAVSTSGTDHWPPRRSAPRPFSCSNV